MRVLKNIWIVNAITRNGEYALKQVDWNLIGSWNNRETTWNKFLNHVCIPVSIITKKDL